ncbi:MAG: family 20 glycosylhydrolase [Phycisphaerae bacterium]|nr:family 20 glycosylhydrolase [Phycisphaerae bacterium]
MTEPLLLPRPRDLAITGGVSHAQSVRVRIEPAIPAEGYSLDIDDAITIGHSTAAGLRHAHATLAQLRVHYGGAIPRLSIRDEPAFATRGVMLDASRDRVPTPAESAAHVERLAGLKLNHLEFYTEHTFAYAGHEEVWRDWSPITPDDVRTLQARATRLGVRLSANQNCFGHLSSWLRHPRYATLAETHGHWEFGEPGDTFARSGPFSLCPIDPASITLVKDLLDQLLPCFESPLVNIGCDETFDIGFGRSAEAVRTRGRAAVYVDYVRQVCDLVRAHGKRPMFWADIALSHPESIAWIPDDLIGLAWGYEPDAPFERWCRLLRDAGRDAWVCPGTSSWRSITGRTSERTANLAAAAACAGLADGFLVTDWGDLGHHQQWPISLHAIAHAADAAWNSADTSRSRDAVARGQPSASGASGLCDAISLHVFGDPSLRIGRWLDALGDLDLPLREIGGRVAVDGSPRRMRNATALFNDLHLPLGEGGDERLRKGLMNLPASLWHEARERLATLERSRPVLADATINAELEHTLAVARLAIDRALLRRGEGSIRRSDLAGRLRDILAEHRRLWLLRSRPGGLDSSTRHYQRILGELEAG